MFYNCLVNFNVFAELCDPGSELVIKKGEVTHWCCLSGTISLFHFQDQGFGRGVCDQQRMTHTE